jgi:hypothetical protein
MTDQVVASLVGGVVGGGIGLISALEATRYAQRLRGCKDEIKRNKQLKSILSIINSELKVQKATWEQRTVHPDWQNKLIGFNLLMAGEIVDMLSNDLVTDLMSVYLNLERVYQILDSFRRYDSEELMNLHLNRFVSEQQSLALSFIDRCVSKVEAMLAVLGSELSELEEQRVELERGWWNKIQRWVGL